MTYKQAERLIKLGHYRVEMDHALLVVVRVSDGKCLPGTASYAGIYNAITYFVRHYNYYATSDNIVPEGYWVEYMG